MRWSDIFGGYGDMNRAERRAADQAWEREQRRNERAQVRKARELQAEIDRRKRARVAEEAAERDHEEWSGRGGD